MLIIDAQRPLMAHEYRAPEAYPSRDTLSRTQDSGAGQLDPPGLSLGLDDVWAEKRRA